MVTHGEGWKERLINAPLEKKARRIDEPLPWSDTSLASVIEKIEELGSNLPDTLVYRDLVKDLDALVRKYCRHASFGYKYKF